MTDLRLLDLFSGIGGFSYAAERLVGGFKAVGFCEIDPFCRQVLNKHWPEVEVFEDVRRPDDFVRCGRVDIITGGYPCQPFSNAGKQKGAADDRHLWPAMFDLIKQKRPDWVVGENVAGHIALGLDEVLFDLESEGYAARPFVIPACGVDAPHRRDRVWIVAKNVGNTNSGECSGDEQASVNGRRQPGLEAGCEAVADTASGRSQEHGHGGAEDAVQRGEVLADATRERVEGHGPAREQEPRVPPGKRISGRNRARAEPNLWLPEPELGRVAHGIPRRVDRLKSLGNSIVPQVAAQILAAIKEEHFGKK